MPTMDGPTHLFNVRLWFERGDNGKTVVRARVEHVLSRRVHYTSSLEELSIYVTTMMKQQEATQRH